VHPATALKANEVLDIDSPNELARLWETFEPRVFESESADDEFQAWFAPTQRPFKRVAQMAAFTGVSSFEAKVAEARGWPQDEADVDEAGAEAGVVSAGSAAEPQRQDVFEATPARTGDPPEPSLSPSAKRYASAPELAEEEIGAVPIEYRGALRAGDEVAILVPLVGGYQTTQAVRVSGTVRLERLGELMQDDEIKLGDDDFKPWEQYALLPGKTTTVIKPGVLRRGNVVEVMRNGKQQRDRIAAIMGHVGLAGPYVLRENQEIRVNGKFVDRWELLELEPGEIDVELHAPPVAGMAQDLHNRLLQVMHRSTSPSTDCSRESTSPSSD